MISEESLSFYKEICNELTEPVDGRLPLDVQRELYESKWSYLHTLRQRCFISVNKQDNKFTLEDMQRIASALARTEEHMRQCCIAIVQQSISKVPI